MEKLFEEFLRECVYFRNLAASTISFYQQAFDQFKGGGAFDELSKQSLKSAIIGFRERGTGIGGINAYIRGVNVFLKWLNSDHGYELLRLEALSQKKRVMRPLNEVELRAIVRFKPSSMSANNVREDTEKEENWIQSENFHH